MICVKSISDRRQSTGGYLAERVQWTRKATFAPGRFLLVLDWLGARWTNEFRQWFQFAPEWQAELRGDRVAAMDGERHMTVAELTGDSTPSAIFCGSIDPMQGWASRQAGSLVPIASFHFHQRARVARFATLFVPSGGIEIEKAALNTTLSKGEIRWSDGDGRRRFRFHRDGDDFEASLEQG